MKTFNLLSKMMLRSIKNNIMQFLAIISIGAIAVTLFVGLLSNADVFEHQVNTVYKNGDLADIWVTTNQYDNNDKDDISKIIEEDSTLDSRYYLPTMSNSHSINLTIVHDLPIISKPYNIKNQNDDFLYVDYDLYNSDSKNYSIDNNITFSLDISSYGLQDNPLVSLLDGFVKDGGKNIFKSDKLNISSTITGYMNHPENITKAQYNSSVVLMSDSKFRQSILDLINKNFKEDVVNIIYDTLAQIVGFNSLDSKYITNPNQYLIKINKNIDETKNQIRSYFEQKNNRNLLYITDRTQMPFYITINSDVTQARQFTFVFPMVFFLVAILVILTTISQMVLKDRTQIGTLKAIGVSRFLITIHYMLITSLLVLISIIIGSILGPLIIPNILGKKYLIIYSLPTPTYIFPTVGALISSLIFIGLAALETYVLCRKEINLNPAQSMRPRVVKMKLHRRKNKTHKTFFFSLKMAIRNIFINKFKAIMTLVGILGCSALLACGFGIEDTINYGIYHDQETFYSADLTLTFNQNQSYDELKKDLNKIEGINIFEPVLQTSTTMYINPENQITNSLFIVENDSKYCKIDFPLDSVALSTKVAEKLNAKIGDNITYTYNGKQITSTIGAINEAFFRNGLTIHKESKDLLSVNNILYSQAYIDVDNNTNFNDVKSKLLELDYITEAKTKEDFNAKVSDLMSGIMVMTNAIKIFAILLGIVVLYNLTLMNFKEKNRDIATLKVLGFNQFEIERSLLYESLLLTLIGVIIGIALGYPFMLAVMNTNKVELVHYLFTIKPISYVNSFILTFGVAIVINILLSLRIKKVQMIESLKSVE